MNFFKSKNSNFKANPLHFFELDKLVSNELVHFDGSTYY